MWEQSQVNVGELTCGVLFQWPMAWDAQSSSPSHQWWVPQPQLFPSSGLVHQISSPNGWKHHWVTQKQMPLPSFVEIARSLWGDDSPCRTIDVSLELTTAQGFLAGTAMTMVISSRVQQDTVTSVTYLDTVTASMSLISLGSTPMAVDCQMPVLENLTDSD